jgi:ribonuclease Z
MIEATPICNRAILSTSTYLKWDGLRILLDTGPGTATRIYKNKIGLSKINVILISHVHIDHFWDLVPILWLRTIEGQGRKKICIIFPEPDKALIQWCVNVSQSNEHVDLHGVKPNDTISVSNIDITAFEADHVSENLCLGYTLMEKSKRILLVDKLKKDKIPIKLWRHLAKGKSLSIENRILEPDCYSIIRQRKVVYSGDSKQCETLLNAAKDADLLITEATFATRKSYQHLAEKHGHMTVSAACDIALKAKVKHALFTHISLRHTIKEIQEEINKFVANKSYSPSISVGLNRILIP